MKMEGEDLSAHLSAESSSGYREQDSDQVSFASVNQVIMKNV